MEVIGSLISLHPNELGAHRVNCAIKGLDIHLSELPWKRSLQLWIRPLPEAAAAPNNVFPHPRLRFGDGARTGVQIGKICPFNRCPEALRVQTMPGFVERAEERRVQEILVVANSQPDIVARELDFKRMHRSIQPTAVVIETEGFGNRQSKLALLLDLEMLVNGRVADLVGLFANRCNQCG